MNLVVWVSAALLALAAVVTVAAAVRRRPIPDRAIALDTIVSLVICGLAAGAVRSGDGVFADIALVLALLGFVATSTIARYLERRQP